MNRKRNNKLDEYFNDNPTMKNIFFVFFYLIFFIIIGLILRAGNSKSTCSELRRDNTGLNKSYSLNEISNKNYHFNINEEVNGSVTIYDGDLNDDKASFIKSGNPSLNYYYNDYKFYLRNNNTLTYEEVDNPISFSKLITSSSISNMLIHGTYLSYTNYFNGEEKDFNYSISTSTLIKYLDEKDVDTDDNPNMITVKVYNGSIEEIDMDLTSYFKCYNKNINSYKLTINYSKYGSIDPINIKVN